MKKIERGPKGKIGIRAKEDPVGLTYDGFREFGDYFKIQLLPGVSWYVISDPAAVEHIFIKNSSNYIKPPLLVKALSPLLGKGVLITQEAAKASAIRKQLIPLLQTKAMEEISPQLSALFSRALEEQLPERTNTIEAFQFMLDLNFRVFSELLLGEDFSRSTEKGKQLFSLLDHVHSRMHNPLSPPMWIPSASNRNFRKIKSALDEHFWLAIMNRKDQRKDDLLGALLTIFPANEIEKNRTWLLDQIYTLLFAAHDTLGTAFGWLIHLLSHHPLVMSKLRKDFEAGHQEYFKLVLNECLRLYPTAWALPRRTIKDDIINGHFIPKGKMIIISQYVIHRHPAYWNSPEEFRPERFETFDPIKNRYTYLPFGYGSRMCLGNNLTHVMGRELFRVLVRDFDFHSTSPLIVPIQSTSTLRARNGIGLSLIKR